MADVVEIVHVSGSTFKVPLVADVDVDDVGSCDDTGAFCVFSKDDGAVIDERYTTRGYSLIKSFGNYDYPSANDDNEEDDATHEEEDVVDELMSLVIPGGKGALITGAGGTGKTTLIVEMIDTVFVPPVVLTAMTGEAAEILSASGLVASTLHHVLKIFHGDVENMRLDAVSRRHEFADEPFDAGTLVIDEVSMMSAKVFEFVLSVLKRIAPTCTVVLCADFAQLPPVVRHNDAYQYCFESSHFANFIGDRIYELTENHRNTDPRWLTMINQHLRLRGTLTDADVTMMSTMTPLHRPLTPEHVHIFPTRQMVHDYNMAMLDANPNRLITVQATFKYDHKLRRAKDFVQDAEPHASLRLPDLDNYTVSFKVDARIRLTRNVDVAQGLHNGATGIVETVRSDNKVVVKFDGRAGVHTFDPTTTVIDSDTRFANGGVMHRYQVMGLPFRLAYACTIHSTQGGTYDKLCIHFASDDEPHRCRIFAPGQAYVALSRPTHPDNVVLVHPETLPREGLTDERVVAFYTETVPAAIQARRQRDQQQHDTCGNAVGFRLEPPLPDSMRTLLSEARAYYTQRNTPSFL